MSRVRREPGSNKRTWILATVIVGVLFLIFSSAKGKYQFPLGERIVTSSLAPFQSAINNVGNQARRMLTVVWEIATVYDQNKMLQSEVKQLRAVQVQVNEATAENQRLRALLGYKQSATQFDLLTASVIARDPGNWTDTIIINRGTNDGLKKDLAVVTAEGLVGNVVEVLGSTARVQLVLDPRNSVGSIVQRAESRVAGIVEGVGANKTTARMVNIPRDADIVEGDQILTSGFGGIYPKGIVIGMVESVANDDGGLLKYAVVKPAVNFQKLEEVAVIVQSREAPPAPLSLLPETSGQKQKPAAQPEGRK